MHLRDDDDVIPLKNTHLLQILPPQSRGLRVDRLHLVEVVLRHVGPHRESEVVAQVIYPFLHKLDELVELLQLGEGVLQELLTLRPILDRQSPSQSADLRS